MTMRKRLKQIAQIAQQPQQQHKQPSLMPRSASNHVLSSVYYFCEFLDEALEGATELERREMLKDVREMVGLPRKLEYDIPYPTQRDYLADFMHRWDIS